MRGDLRYDWRERREKRYLEAQWQIILVCAIAGIALAIITRVWPPPDQGREISIAATACWDQGMRAILHRDDSIECRP
jgi:hypothetical protein